jgi:hypothetical protein
MVFAHPKINTLEGGWYVVYGDGSVVTENDMPWIKVPNKTDIKIMGLKWRHKHFELEGKKAYVAPGETHMRELSMRDTGKVSISKPSVVGRFIGYYDTDKKVITRVDLTSGKFITEEVPYD